MREKEEFIRDFNEAFSKNDQDFILNNMTEDIIWDFIGERKVEGKEAVKEFMKPMEKVETLELELEQIITHGRTAAANGRMKIREASGEIKSFGFADFYVFSGLKTPKVKKMTSYVVGLKEEKKENL
ncbi:Ketosteroid isomerase-related protein [Salinimicrobium sediminis]|uniref:Ketosteroid isomerase-related protein n=1 Tax=Salinimicrobium sediminis TaxID=1343891 RepID=A0A285X7Q6_9FLAO|nr:nuclear transport factor 2 family protein [Salinimicrobium sediminis]SOC81046.1 Ketosteroid isomerase-related protein [Salinimicrobium sediminis]